MFKTSNYLQRNKIGIKSLGELFIMLGENNSEEWRQPL